MPRMRNGQFLDALDKLIRMYPEYASILIQLKNQIEQVNKAKFEAKLKQLKNGSF